VVFAGLVDAVFPVGCVACGARGAPVCSACGHDLAPARPTAPPAFVDDWFALYEYEGVARELVARIKYRNARAILPAFADAIAQHARRRWQFDAITWAPTTRAHQRDRGFDHARLLARAVARRTDVPLRALLTRTTDEPQTGRPHHARQAGVTFEARGRVPPSVLLLDDVATSGATLRAAARALRGDGAQHVYAATIARTPPPRSRRARPAYTPPR
jgi:predicted amidophosphoribosyltransferase